MKPPFRVSLFAVLVQMTILFLLATAPCAVGQAGYHWENLAGSVQGIGNRDGTGTEALFYSPSSVAVDGDGSLFVADTSNHTIRKITSAGVVNIGVLKPNQVRLVDDEYEYGIKFSLSAKTG